MAAKLGTISHDLLSNPVIEDYEVKLEQPEAIPNKADFEGLPDPDEESIDDLIKLEIKPKKAIKKLAKVEKKAAKPAAKIKVVVVKDKKAKKKKKKKSEATTDH